jgi:hypothetical protein
LLNANKKAGVALNRGGATYNHMGTFAGLRALSDLINVPDVAEMEWVMPWDTPCIPASFVPRRLVGDSAKFVFKEHGLFVNGMDIGQHRGLNLSRLACVSLIFASLSWNKRVFRVTQNLNGGH